MVTPSSRTVNRPQLKAFRSAVFDLSVPKQRDRSGDHTPDIPQFEQVTQLPTTIPYQIGGYCRTSAEGPAMGPPLHRNGETPRFGQFFIPSLFSRSIPSRGAHLDQREIQAPRVSHPASILCIWLQTSVPVGGSSSRPCHTHAPLLIPLNAAPRIRPSNSRFELNATCSWNRTLRGRATVLSIPGPPPLSIIYVRVAALHRHQ